jgi:hypothetical protein
MNNEEENELKIFEEAIINRINNIKLYEMKRLFIKIEGLSITLTKGKT